MQRDALRGVVGRLDRYPLNSPWVRALVSRFGLPTWFGLQSMLAIATAAGDTELLYFDARLYLDATEAWLMGANPWGVQIAGNFFAAPPPTLLPLVPFALLPRDLGVAIIAVLVIAGGIATIRLLRLPWWWILFPPLVQCFLSANVQSLLVPLVLVGAGGAATFLKVYSAVPLLILGRWRALLLAAAALVLTIPLLPWEPFLDQLPQITDRLNEQTKHNLPPILAILLVPIALVAMTLVGRHNAAWLAVPAIWPSPQYYYRTLAMPVRNDVVAAIVALPLPGSPIGALVVLAIITWREGHRPPWIAWIRRVPHEAGPSAR